MSALVRLLAIAMTITLLGASGCLKPNPLAQQFADGETDSGETDSGGTDSGETDSGLPDLPDSTDSGTCEAPQELEPTCAACLVESCCTSLVPCGEDPVCVCLADCLFAGASDNECRMLCGEKPQDVGPLAPLLSCAMTDCPTCFVP